MWPLLPSGGSGVWGICSDTPHGLAETFSGVSHGLGAPTHLRSPSVLPFTGALRSAVGEPSVPDSNTGSSFTGVATQEHLVLFSGDIDAGVLVCRVKE